MLEKNSSRIETQLAKQPAVRAELHDTIGRIYRDLTLWPQAAQAFRLALAAHVQDGRPESNEAADAMLWLGSALHTLKQSDEAVKILREVIRIKTALHGPNHLELAWPLNQLGTILTQDDDKANVEGEELVRRALVIREKSLPPGHLETATS